MSLALASELLKLDINPAGEGQPDPTSSVSSAPTPTPHLSHDEIIQLLLPYQIKHFMKLVAIYERQRLEKPDGGVLIAIDLSDTGIGKTYIEMALCAWFKMNLFAVCPKAIITDTIKVAKLFKVNILGVSNYESIKCHRQYNANMQREHCPFVQVTEKAHIFEWTFPPNTHVTFDEAQRCKNHKTQNAKMLMGMKSAKVASGNPSGNSWIHLELMSATITDRIDMAKMVCYMTGLCATVKTAGLYLRRLYRNHPQMTPMEALHHQLVPKCASRLRIADLGDAFPKNQIISKSYYMGEEIQEQMQAEYANLQSLASAKQDAIKAEHYELIDDRVTDLKELEEKSNSILAKMIRIRQRIELLRVDTLIEKAEEHLEAGKSVVIFVNYCDTIRLLASRLSCECLIWGEQTMEERAVAIAQFQSNQSKLIIATYQSGGVAISLHDIHGGHPRVSLFSPTWSAQDFVQAFGRIFRANGKTPCLQEIIFCSGTLEERICELLQEKIDNYARLNDGQAKSHINLG
jgi:hypothetical protein